MPKQPRSNRPDTPGRPAEHFARGFEFYLDGRHGTFCGQHEAAGYLFHLAAELMLKAVLLEDAHVEAMDCIYSARSEVTLKEGPDAELDPQEADACLEPYRKRAEQLKHDYEHCLDRLWRDSITRLAKPELNSFSPLITKISQWEKFRYPVFVHGRSKASTLTTAKGGQVRHWANRLINRSEVNLGEVDELVAALVQAVGYSTNWVRMRARGRSGLDTYRRDNRYVIAGVFERRRGVVTFLHSRLALIKQGLRDRLHSLRRSRGT
jgi:hypothetical protein